MRTRNICVGTVYRDGLLVEMGQLRSRKCLSVNWRGQTSVLQPWQFLDERQVVNAVRGRLAMAGLKLVQVEIKREPGRGEYEPIRCVVARLYCPHSRAVQINRMIQSWQVKREDLELVQQTMVEVALAIGRKEVA